MVSFALPLVKQDSLLYFSLFIYLVCVCVCEGVCVGVHEGQRTT